MPNSIILTVGESSPLIKDRNRYEKCCRSIGNECYGRCCEDIFNHIGGWTLVLSVMLVISLFVLGFGSSSDIYKKSCTVTSYSNPNCWVNTECRKPYPDSNSCIMRDYTYGEDYYDINIGNEKVKGFINYGQVNHCGQFMCSTFSNTSKIYYSPYGHIYRVSSGRFNLASIIGFVLIGLTLVVYIIVFANPIYAWCKRSS